jgi:hypothetical protein
VPLRRSGRAIAWPIIPTRRSGKGIYIRDLDDLLAKGKTIRKKYKALMKRCDDLKKGDVADAAEIRELADALKEAIDGAHSGAK